MRGGRGFSDPSHILRSPHSLVERGGNADGARIEKEEKRRRRRGLKIVAIIVHKGVHIVVVVNIVVKAENLVGAITVVRAHAIK